MIQKITDPARKAQIARDVLEALQDWFGVEESREYYIRESQSWDFFAAVEGEDAVGFLCLKETGNATVELAVMGVKQEYHRHGLGRELFQAAKAFAVAAGYEFMQVKTVAMGFYEDYDRTNRFYQSVGFKELEIFPLLWDEANPCQIYIQSLKEDRSLPDLIINRHSYRGKYKTDKVPEEDLKKILEAGLAAPSGCNRQTTSLICVDDEELLTKIKAVIDPPIGETAPAMICVLTRRIFAYRDKCFATQDYSAAIETMLLAITALGYQSCWYEGHVTDDDRIGDQIAKILKVPEEYELVCVLPVGIPDFGGEDREGAVKVLTGPKKLPFEKRAWFNGFPTGFSI